MEILYNDKFKGKYFYLVTNEFEHMIENYKKDLNTIALNKGAEDSTMFEISSSCVEWWSSFVCSL